MAKRAQKADLTGTPIAFKQEPKLPNGIKMTSFLKDCHAGMPKSDGSVVGMGPSSETIICPPEFVMDGVGDISIYPQGEALSYNKEGKRAVYPFKTDARSLVVQAEKEESGARRFLAVFENKSAPTYMDFKLELPGQYFLTLDKEKGHNPVIAFDSSTLAGTDTPPPVGDCTERPCYFEVGGMGLAWALDSKDRLVEADWEYVDMNTVRLNIVGNKTLDGHKITYPVIADPWFEGSWDWFWGDTTIVHFESTEIDELAELVDDFEFFSSVMCGFFGLLGPEAIFLIAACEIFVHEYFESFAGLAEEAAAAGCGAYITFWNDGVIPVSWNVECAAAPQRIT